VQDTLSSAKLVNQQAFSQVNDVDVGAAASDLTRAKVLMQYQASSISSMNSLQASLIKQLTA
jgi:flagellin-like hook-associated protein FlgL